MALETLLTTKGLVLQSPSPSEIRSRANLVAPEPLQIFYGETYDDAGNTIDSMKYYFFVAALTEELGKEGIAVDPTILVADTAACRNVGKKNEAYYMQLGENRTDFVRRVNDTYNTGLRVQKMSDYIDSSEFINKREKIITECKENPELMAGVERTVPPSKVEIEREKGFLYSFDEIATIVDLDVKVGPPREDLYDEVARKIAQNEGKPGLMSLFLSPTFPVGLKWSYFFANDGIEEHGITAYKAGSKRLQENRVIINGSDPERIKNLLDNSFISTNPDLPNPVLDVGIIAEMARKRIQNDSSPITLAEEFYEGKMTETELKEYVAESIDRYILSKI